MPTPNLFMTYVRDTAASTDFYRELLEVEPVFTSPRYVAFDLGGDALFALWSGAVEDGLDAAPRPATPRTSEVGIMVDGGAAEVDRMFARWSERAAAVVQAPHDAVFGRTFVIADPDGNLLRVSPRD
ncbi:VOC family protein [Brachybacterium hainanense]|uniref:VOC family protein n=1 Tax=Brachybacterium hainanense TaxID=1541174 RepID=A0ABV6RC56_9MICO